MVLYSLVIIITLIPVVSQAAHAPWSLEIKEFIYQTKVTLSWFPIIFIRIRTGISYATTSLVLKTRIWKNPIRSEWDACAI